jgi:hypothetical protein
LRAAGKFEPYSLGINDKIYFFEEGLEMSKNNYVKIILLPYLPIRAMIANMAYEVHHLNRGLMFVVCSFDRVYMVVI